MKNLITIVCLLLCATLSRAGNIPSYPNASAIGDTDLYFTYQYGGTHDYNITALQLKNYAQTGAVLTSGSYSNPSWLAALNWSKMTGTPTTLSGYGITNAQTHSTTLDAFATGNPFVAGTNVSFSGTYPALTINGYTLPNATTSTLGGMIVGSGLGVTSGNVSVTYGTTSATAAQGNDSRITGALQTSALGTGVQTALGNGVNTASGVVTQSAADSRYASSGSGVTTVNTRSGAVTLTFADVNPMTVIGDIIFGATSGVGTRLSGNTTTTRKFLRGIGDGTNAAAPGWDTVTSTDVGLANVTNDAQVKSSQLDTDGTLAANSDTRVASQKATKAYADTKVTQTTTVNGHALSGNVTVSASDVTTGTLPHAQLPALVSGDIPNNASNTTGTSGNVTGTVAVANGGTGAATLTGLVKGNGTSAMTAATAGIDYTAPNSLPTGSDIIILGDSIIAGVPVVGVDGGGHPNGYTGPGLPFAQYLSSLPANANIPVYNFAVGGTTSSSISSLLSGGGAYTKYLNGSLMEGSTPVAITTTAAYGYTSATPSSLTPTGSGKRLWLFQHGTNDCIAGTTAAFTSWKTNMASAFSTVHGYSANEIVCAVNLIGRNSANGALDNQIDQYNDWLIAQRSDGLAGTSGWDRLANVHAAFPSGGPYHADTSSSTNLSADGTHLNASGQYFYACAVNKGIASQTGGDTTDANQNTRSQLYSSDYSLFADAYNYFLYKSSGDPTNPTICVNLGGGNSGPSLVYGAKNSGVNSATMCLAWSGFGVTLPVEFYNNSSLTPHKIWNFSSSGASALGFTDNANGGSVGNVQLAMGYANSSFASPSWAAGADFIEYPNKDLLLGDGSTAHITLTHATGNITTDGKITAAGLAGVTTNSNASAGNVGEAVASAVASGSAVSLTTATTANVTSISLTAGDWDVSANVNFTDTAATVTGTSAGISATTATLPSDGTEAYSGVQLVTATATDSVTLPRKRVSIASTTTVYLVGQQTFSLGTAAAFGSITARRVR